MGLTGTADPRRLMPILDSFDEGGLAAALAQDPELAVTELAATRGHPHGAAPLNYVAMLRFDVLTHRWRNVSRTAQLARLLLAAGAPAGGSPGDSETPLITAASYGDAEVAAVLIEAGVDLETISAPDAGGVPEAPALAHAAIFGMTEVVDVLLAAGAAAPSPVLAAAAGTLTPSALAESSSAERLLALIMAADHERLAMIDLIVGAGTPIDAADPEWHRQPLRLAASRGKAASVRRLLALGADPALRDEQDRTALDLCRRERQLQAWTGYDEAESLLAAVTPT